MLIIGALGARAGQRDTTREQAPLEGQPLAGLAGREAAGAEPRTRAHRTVFQVLHAAWQEYERDYVRYFAAAMIYYAVLALVPSLLLLMAGLGLLLRVSPAVATAQDEALQAIHRNLGADVASTVQHLLQGLEQQSILNLILSFLGLLLTASVLVYHLRMSFRAIWHYPSLLVAAAPGHMVLRSVAEKVIAFSVVVGGGALLLVTLALIASVNWFLQRISDDWLLVIPSSLVIAPLAAALLFRSLPPRRVPWRYVWPAALLCGVVWVITGSVLMLINNLLGKTSSAYGAVGTLLAAMLWINVLSKALFFGAELCKVLEMPEAGQVPAGGGGLAAGGSVPQRR